LLVEEGGLGLLRYASILAVFWLCSAKLWMASSKSSKISCIDFLGVIYFLFFKPATWIFSQYPGGVTEGDEGSSW
jgi:hypothetical protein